MTTHSALLQPGSMCRNAPITSWASGAFNGIGRGLVDDSGVSRSDLTVAGTGGSSSGRVRAYKPIPTGVYPSPEHMNPLPPALMSQVLSCVNCLHSNGA